MAKELQSPQKVRESLVFLKEELWKRFGQGQTNDPIIMEIYMKINSCLYDQYPHDATQEALEDARRRIVQLESEVKGLNAVIDSMGLRLRNHGL